MVFGFSFSFPSVSFTQFIITLIGGMAATIGMAIYLGVVSYFGREMKPYMTARMKHLSIFQIYSLGNAMRFEYAKQGHGGAFRLLETTGEKIKRWISFLSPRGSSADPGSGTEKSTIIPASTYHVEGVTTVLAFEPFPQINADLRSCVIELKEKGNTIDEVTKHLTDHEININDFLLLGGKYSYVEFLEMYRAAAEKYSFNITVDDVLGFLDKHSSQRFSESLSTRITNSEAKKKRDSWAKKYGFYIVLIWAAGLLLILAYKAVNS